MNRMHVHMQVWIYLLRKYHLIFAGGAPYILRSFSCIERCSFAFISYWVGALENIAVDLGVFVAQSR